jgi:hypothetical protein
MDTANHQQGQVKFSRMEIPKRHACYLALFQSISDRISRSESTSSGVIQKLTSFTKHHLLGRNSVTDVSEQCTASIFSVEKKIQKEGVQNREPHIHLVPVIHFLVVHIAAICEFIFYVRLHESLYLHFFFTNGLNTEYLLRAKQVHNTYAVYARVFLTSDVLKLVTCGYDIQ